MMDTGSEMFTAPIYDAKALARLSRLLDRPFYVEPIGAFPSSKLSLLLDPSVRFRDARLLRPRISEEAFGICWRNGSLLRCDLQFLFIEDMRVIELIDCLTPNLNGNWTLVELCRGLEHSKQEYLSSIIRLLLEIGFLKDMADSLSAQIEETTRTTFAPQIQLLEHLCLNHIESFKSFRESRVLLVGGGDSFRECAASLLQCGLSTLSVVGLDAEDDPLTLAEDMAKYIRVRGCVSLIDRLGRDAARSRDILPKYDLVVYCSDHGSLQDPLLLARACTHERVMFLPARVFGDFSVMGPLMLPQNSGCWPCSLIKVFDDVKGSYSDSFEEVVIRCAKGYTIADAAIAASLGKNLAFEAFKLLCKTNRHQTENGMIIDAKAYRGGVTARHVPRSLFPCVNSCSALNNFST